MEGSKQRLSLGTTSNDELGQYRLGEDYCNCSIVSCHCLFIVLRDCGFSWVISFIQSFLVILKSNGLSEILRDIRTSTYQICRIEEKTNSTTTFQKRICNLTPEVKRYILLPVVSSPCQNRDQIFNSR